MSKALWMLVVELFGRSSLRCHMQVAYSLVDARLCTQAVSNASKARALFDPVKPDDDLGRICESDEEALRHKSADMRKDASVLQISLVLFGKH
eukprot:6196627-Pleurochrysis_carterae.AAC.2